MKPPIVVMLVNQKNTVEPELDKFRKDSRPIDQVASTATYGTPFLLQRRKILGPWPSAASEYRVRDPAKTQELPEENADIKIAALITWFNPAIPAFWMPTTKGLAPAPAPPF